MRKQIGIAFLAIAVFPLVLLASNFPDRRAYIVNNCPFIELSDFSFENKYQDRSDRFHQNRFGDVKPDEKPAKD